MTSAFARSRNPRTLPLCPAEARAGIGEIHDQRRGVGPARGAQGPVVALRGGRVDVERQHPVAQVGRDAAEAAGVRTQVPAHPVGARPDRGEQVADDGFLGVRRAALVARVILVGVVGPLRAAPAPTSEPDTVSWRLWTSAVSRWSEICTCGRLAGIAGVAALRSRVEMDVGTQAQPQACPPGQQRRRQVQRDAVELVAQHPAHADVAPGHERQRAPGSARRTAGRRPTASRARGAGTTGGR